MTSSHKAICSVCGELSVTGNKDKDPADVALVAVLFHMSHNDESHIVVLDGRVKFWVNDGVMHWDDEVAN